MPEDPKTANQPQIVINQQPPITYINAANVGLSVSELQITFALNGRPVNTIVMNHIIAKAFHTSLGKALSDFEKKTGTLIGDLASLNEALKVK